MMQRLGWARLAAALMALAAISLSAWQLGAARDGVSIRTLDIGGMPATVFAPAGEVAPGPAVVIAHGFAGSRQLMRSYALALAQAGYVALSFDFPGHGRNPAPLTGSIMDESGATERLIRATRAAIAAARDLPESDGRVALLGHSMATDVLVRVTLRDPDIPATVAVSMASNEITPEAPRNLLTIVGDWESDWLKQQGYDAARMVAGEGAEIEPGRVYGDFAAGTARKTVLAPAVEHIAVLFSVTAVSEARDWLNRSFGRAPSERGVPARGGWIALLLAGIVTLGWPLAALLPRLAQEPRGADLRWRALAAPMLVPAIGAPLLLWLLPTDFMPVLVGDDLAVFFLLYGLLTSVVLAFGGHSLRAARPLPKGAYPAALAIAIFGIGLFGGAIHLTAANFMPGMERIPLIVVMLAGTLTWALADEWMTRGAGAARFAYPVSKLVFIASLLGAVALQPEEMFFLLIVLPAIFVFFIVLGLVSRWSYRATGHPWPAAIGNAAVLAWAIGVTFPILGG